MAHPPFQRALSVRRHALYTAYSICVAGGRAQRVNPRQCVRCVLFACVRVCGGGVCLGLGLWLGVGSHVPRDNIDIVHNQFGSANQRYCALPHHSSTFGLTPWWQESNDSVRTWSTYMLNTRNAEINTIVYSCLACFMNTVTLNMYVSVSYTGLYRRNTIFVFLWLRHRNTWISIQHVGWSTGRPGYK